MSCRDRCLVYRSLWSALIAAVTLGGAACDPLAPGASHPGADGAALTLATPAEEEAVLRFVGHRWTTWEVLYHEVDLDPSAAYALVTHRDGADRVPETADDGALEALADLAAVPGIDDEALRRLVAFAGRRGWGVGADPFLGVFDAVAFTLAEAEHTVAVANAAPYAMLDEDAGLLKNAVARIVAARPIADVRALAAVDYLGPFNMERLKAFALERAPLAGDPEAPPCPLQPLLTPAAAEAQGGDPGQYTVCLEDAAADACPTAAAIDARALVEAVAGDRDVAGCASAAAATCGPFGVGAGAPCCYVVTIDPTCE